MAQLQTSTQQKPNNVSIFESLVWDGLTWFAMYMYISNNERYFDGNG